VIWLQRDVSQEKTMITTAFLFPRSQYLVARWWHRFATVLFWAWFVFVLVSALNILVFEPFTSCVQIKIQSEMLLDKPSNLDCGANAFGYALLNGRESSALEVIAGTAALSFIIFFALALPGLVYRLVLYVAKGSSWKDAKAPA
jgi:hypothetical protein